MLDFNDTKTAFARKSDGEMRNALMLFRMMKRPGLVKAGKRACGAAARLHLPVGWIVKPTLYRQFVGGETLEECGPTVDGLERAGVKAAPDYSAESEQTPVGIEAVFAETERSIEYAARNKNVAYAVFKPSTLTTDTLLAKASEHPETLTAAERTGFDAFAARFDALCALAHRHGVRILVDAEDVRFQDAVDRLTEEAMHRYNGGRAIVFATLQMYRCDRLPYLRRLYEDVRQADCVAGVKFVRGAYMEGGTLPLAKGGLDYARQYDYAENPSNSSLNQPWNGFLSLRKTAARVLACNQEGNAKDQVPSGLPEGAMVNISSNKDYYETTNKGVRKYVVGNGTHEEADGNYSITENDDHLLASIPLYTRAKQMHIKTGYTGNNPYVAYQRHAKVKITATVKVYRHRTYT